MKYVKPVVIANEEIAEGVFAASGEDCYTFSAYIAQTPETGNPLYTIQVNGVHNAEDGHHSLVRTVLISFNQPVNYNSSNAAEVSGSGTSQLSLTFVDGVNGSYHNNASDNIGLGQLKVSSADGLQITGVVCTYCNKECTGYGH